MLKGEPLKKWLATSYISAGRWSSVSRN